ncbi:uncharacterized protein ACB058_008750 isoform 1-T1 [Synchiropus picturatus]
MAASLLRVGRLSLAKCLQLECGRSLRTASPAAALSSKTSGSNNKKKKNSDKSAKTYFDIEKLVQHKPVGPSNRVSAAAVPESAVTPAAAATPTGHAASMLAKAVPVVPDVAPVPEVQPLVESVPHAEAAAEAVPLAVPLAEAVPLVEAAAEAVPLAEAAAEAVPVEDVAAEAVPLVEVAAEAVPLVEAAAEATAAQAVPVEDVAAAAALEAAPDSEKIKEAADVSHVVDVVAEVMEAAAGGVSEAAPVVEAIAEAAGAADVMPVVEAVSEVLSQVVESSEKLADDASGEAAREESTPAPLDPIQKLFLEAIRGYSHQSPDASGPLDVGPDYQKALAEETAKLQRLFGGGDLESFPEFNFPGESRADASYGRVALSLHREGRFPSCPRTRCRWTR